MAAKKTPKVVEKSAAKVPVVKTVYDNTNDPAIYGKDYKAPKVK
jgi:hypothetical protein